MYAKIRHEKHVCSTVIRNIFSFVINSLILSSPSFSLFSELVLSFSSFSSIFTVSPLSSHLSSSFCSPFLYLYLIHFFFLSLILFSLSLSPLILLLLTFFLLCSFLNFTILSLTMILTSPLYIYIFSPSPLYLFFHFLLSSCLFLDLYLIHISLYPFTCRLDFIFFFLLLFFVHISVNPPCSYPISLSSSSPIPPLPVLPFSLSYSSHFLFLSLYFLLSLAHLTSLTLSLSSTLSPTFLCCIFQHPISDYSPLLCICLC
jgi:hypothetical protein